MARIQIDLPERFIFSTEIPIYIGHINLGGHLDNALLLTLVSEARVRLFGFLGFPDLKVDGVGLIMADAAAQYKSEASYGETMVVDITPDGTHKRGFDVAWRMKDRASGREVARGKSGMLFFDYAQRKVQPTPTAFTNRLAELGVPQPGTSQP